MKKSIAVILLGSALLLPNNNNVEASYGNNDVQVKTFVQTIGWEDLQNYSANNMNGKLFFNGYQIDLNQFFNKYANTNGNAYGKSYKYKSHHSHAKKNYDRSNQTPAETPVEVKPPVQAPVEKPAPAPVEKPAAPAPAPTPAPTPEKPAPAPVEKPAPTQNASISAVEQEVLDLTNAERQKAGLSPLQIDKNLMNSARQKSTDMSKNNYFSHTSPTYGSPFDQMKANGVTYRAAAENIAAGQRSAKEVVQAWMDSPGHKQNILTPSFTHIGIGFDATGNYWTQQFIQK